MKKLLFVVFGAVTFGCTEADPVSLEAFESALPLQVCAGIFGYPNANPKLRHITRIADEPTCRSLLRIEDFDRRWPATRALLTSGDLTFDELAAGRCLTSVARGMGNGYLGWMHVPECQKVVNGLRSKGESCVVEDCEQGTACVEGVCSSRGCLDTHECSDGEWCYYQQCEAFVPKGGLGAPCVVFTDDGWPQEHCDLGLVCPMLSATGADFAVFGQCMVPHSVGEPCFAEEDCEFGLQCDRTSCEEFMPCTTATCQASP